MKTYRISDGDLYGNVSENVTGSLEDARTAAREWVHWYNHRRLFEPLGHVPPAEFEAHYDHPLHESAMAA